MGSALEEAIFYQVILLEITRAFMNTQSFMTETTFQKTVMLCLVAENGLFSEKISQEKSKF